MGKRGHMTFGHGSVHRPKAGIASTLLLGLVVGTTACESTTEPQDIADPSTDPAAAVVQGAGVQLLETAADELDLTSDQRSQLQAIGERYADETPGPSAAWLEARDVQAVLSSEQIEQAQAIAIERRQEMAASRSGGGRMHTRPRRGRAGFGRLELTEYQRECITFCWPGAPMCAWPERAFPAQEGCGRSIRAVAWQGGAVTMVTRRGFLTPPGAARLALPAHG